MKKRIVELCYRIALSSGIKCDAYFSNVHYTGVKVSVTYGRDTYTFKSYRETIEFLERALIECFT